eukprot:m.62030 g.62030  ORF g.62030 m.62030 type:complete len:207 (+) comp23071_c1_seq1:369-989(+)
MEPSFVLRRYVPADYDGVIKVSLQTGDAGTDATEKFKTHPTLIGARWSGPYCTLSPELAFVLVDSHDTVCGYTLAALDSREFYVRLKQHLVKVAAGFPSPSALPKDMWGPEEELINEINNPTVHLPDELYASYPSHLHIDLAPHAQGFGYGGKAMAMVFSALRDQGSKGVHLEMSRSNTRAFKFYTKLGFAVIPSDTEALYLGLQF